MSCYIADKFYPKVKGSEIFFNTEKIPLLENYIGLLRLRSPYSVFSISSSLKLNSWGRLRFKESESLTEQNCNYHLVNACHMINISWTPVFYPHTMVDTLP